MGAGRNMRVVDLEQCTDWGSGTGNGRKTFLTSQTFGKCQEMSGNPTNIGKLEALLLSASKGRQAKEQT